MGAWGLGPFENDGALDALSDLEHGDADGLAAHLAAAIDAADYLEVDQGQAAIAAAELVAAAVGHPAAGLPPRVAEVLAAKGDAVRSLGAVGQARAAVARVFGENSELAELWDEVEDGPAWRQSVAALQRRLGSGEG